MATGHVGFPVLAINNLSPFLSWSVLLRDKYIDIQPSCTLMSHGFMFTNSLKRRKPANESKQAMAKHRSENEPDLEVSSLTIRQTQESSL